MMVSSAAPWRGINWHVLVMAKSPVAGLVKTRLCPPLTLGDAARVAEAALADTLDSVARCGADRRILALDGPPGDWVPPGFTVVAQRGTTFDRRLAAAWSDAGGPGLQIGMDTPQVTADLLDYCLEIAARPGASASLGPALDGGWWAIALAERWNVDVFSGVPMSTPLTGAAQLARLAMSGHRVRALPAMQDVDLIDDATEVAALAPRSRFARALHATGATAC
jgi:glycosyltransferase A (GT-A) superfamily protein (DUF2064 family)